MSNHLIVNLSAKHKIHATGFYLYEQHGGPNTFREFIIDPSGHPQPAPPHPNQRIINNVNLQSISFSQANEPQQLWMPVSVPNSTQYLSFNRAESNQQIFSSNNCQLVVQGGIHVLSDNMYGLLYTVLEARHDEGYDRMFDAILRNDLWILPAPLKESGQGFWEALSNVARQGRGKFGASLNEPNNPTSFNNPDWAFQLIRIIAEGFIEGHAAHFGPQAPTHQAPQSKNYQVQSINQWVHILSITGYTDVDDFDQNAPLALKDTLYGLVLGISSTNLLRKTIAKALLNLTPGATFSAKLFFWIVHWPHWGFDLRQALIENGPRAPTTNNNMHDWALFADVIIKGYPFLQANFVSALAFLLISSGVTANSAADPKNFILRIFNRVIDSI